MKYKKMIQSFKNLINLVHNSEEELLEILKRNEFNFNSISAF